MVSRHTNSATPAASTPVGDDTLPALEARGLAVQLGSYLALSGVDLSLPAGSFTAIIGPNGAGKSTLLKCLLGLIPPSTGDFLLFGQAPGQVPADWLGYVPQLKTLDRSFPAPTCELVVSGLRRAWPWRIGAREHELAVEALRRVGAAHLAHKPVKWLSGGELQRVYLARALIRRPRLLLLDEPATGIDLSGEHDMYELLEQEVRERGLTVLMVTHDWLTAAHHASLALLLNRRVLACGPPPQVLGGPEILALFGHSGHDHAGALAREGGDA